MTKLKIISNHTKYQKDQIVDLEEKEAILLLTSGKAIRIHRKQIEEKLPEAKKGKK
jgi:hypothetical protein